MINYDFEKSVSYWIGLTAHVFEQALSAELAQSGVTIRQVQVLACLALAGEDAQMYQAELAQQMAIEASTLVRVLDRMERDGWIERHDSPVDRRKKLISTTEKVKPHWAAIVEKGDQMQKRATAGIGPAELKQLKATLEKIRVNLGVNR